MTGSIDGSIRHQTGAMNAGFSTMAYNQRVLNSKMDNVDRSIQRNTDAVRTGFAGTQNSINNLSRTTQHGFNQVNAQLGQTNGQLRYMNSNINRQTNVMQQGFDNVSRGVQALDSRALVINSIKQIDN